MPEPDAENPTMFTAYHDPKDDAPTRERRAHTWRERERMAWWCMFGILVSMFVPLAVELKDVSGRVIENGQWVLGVALLTFIGGKAAVEGFVAVKAPRP